MVLNQKDPICAAWGAGLEVGPALREQLLVALKEVFVEMNMQVGGHGMWLQPTQLDLYIGKGWPGGLAPIYDPSLSVLCSVFAGVRAGVIK